ncbi:transglutaminase family protein [uncultured Streptomyces sp.]|uniref:transglutaminase-like domain-containing protein n=1 Tax=uncultured Streptomyces sp. TaxID=174707 RepID=UPI002626717D|nr:transglutaminase family protein [uncultured Streptomyces sp.]
MEPLPAEPGIAPYLAADDVIDHEHPAVRAVAGGLGFGTAPPHTYAAAAYTHVRDTIPHSMDSGDPRVTWRASDVLTARTGICYAKSHALVALLRAAAIPAGLCYQRLTEDDGSAPVVHGLVALRLPGTERWVRQDPRGNKPGVDAQFSLERERPAWTVRPELGEIDYPRLYATPPPAILRVLRAARDRQHLAGLLPTAL